MIKGGGGMRKWIQAVSLITVSAVFCCLFGACRGAGDDALTVQSLAAVSETDDDWESVDSGVITLQNDIVRFELDAQTTHFTVTDLRSGKQYLSVPAEESATFSEEVSNRLESELTIRYYDENSAGFYMYSTADSVDNNGVTIKRSADRIRVYYSFGSQDAELLVPELLPAADFERITEALSSSARRRINIYYSLYSPSEQNEDYAAMLEKYPILASGDFYVLDDSVSSLNRMDISGYMSQAGYTREEYEQFLADNGIEQAKSEEPGFVVPVEYELTADGFRARLLTDKITEQTERYKLVTIDLLQFFGACGSQENGYYLVPDGSGALIEMNTSNTGSFSSSFYGNDYSLYSEEQTMLTQNTMLPVWGMSAQSGGLFAITEGAAAVADLNVQTISASNPANTAWASFYYRTVDTEQKAEMGTGAGNAEGIFNLYCSSPLTELPTVRYCLLEAGKNTYSDMAAYYRRYLKDNDKLADSEERADVLIDYYCMLVTEESFLGIPYQKKTVLSTLGQITESLNRLYEAGVENISVRLIGYGKSGIYHGPSNRFSIDRRVGSVEELRQLDQLISQHGGTLHLEADYQLVYSDGLGDGFSQRTDTAYYLNKQLVAKGNYNLVTREYLTENRPYFVTPARYLDFAGSFLQEFAGTAQGIGYQNTGFLLGGDYSSGRNFNRTVSQRLTEQALESMSQQTQLLVGGGNGYVLPYASALTDIPTGSSDYDLQWKTVPFYQMVVHGSIPYSTVAYNTASARDDLLLKMIESGSGLHFSFICEDDDLLIDTPLQTELYSLAAEKWEDEIAVQFEQYGAFLESVRDVEITSHEELSNGVYRTAYANGTVVIVNYSEISYAADGKTVEAGSFSIEEER